MSRLEPVDHNIAAMMPPADGRNDAGTYAGLKIAFAPQ